MYRDFTARACLTREGFYLYDSLSNLRNFKFKQPAHQPGMRTRHNEMYAAHRVCNLYYKNLIAFTDLISVGANLFVRHKNRLCTVDFKHYVAAFDSSYNRCCYIVFAIRIFAYHLFTFSLMNTLKDNLARSLCRDSSKRSRGYLNFDRIANVILTRYLSRVIQRNLGFSVQHFFNYLFVCDNSDCARFFIKHNAYVMHRTKVLFVRRY